MALPRSTARSHPHLAAAAARRTPAQGSGRTLPHLVVVALGTNGAVSAGVIRRLLSTVRSTRVLALVTPRNHALQGIPGWAGTDWTLLPGPWIDAYRRRDRCVVVATAPVAHG